MSAKSSFFGLYVGAAALLVSAFALWQERRAETLRSHISSQIAQKNAQFGAAQSSQRATALLYQSFWADTHLKFSARAHTQAAYGGALLDSQARLTHTPGALSIQFISGPSSGTQQGFSQNWFWRSRGANLTPYAEASANAGQMAERRFALMLDNYAAVLCPPQILNGREVEVVQLRPWHTSDGASGPARRVWLDRQNHLTLRVENFNYKMQRVSQSDLFDLDFSPRITPTTFELPQTIRSAAQKTAWMGEEIGADSAQVAAKAGVQPPRPSWLPVGFAWESFGVHRCPVTKCTGALSRFSDGLNSLTIYAFSAAPPGGAPASCNFGPGTLVSREVGKGRLVAVGDLPPQTLARVLESTQL